MIHDQDRSGWFGASDTYQIMGNWHTNTFYAWWMEKCGLRRNLIKTPAMMAGTMYEHAVLRKIGIRKVDRQIKMKSLRLRVNLDGEDRNTIYEVKTHMHPFAVSKRYWMQAQVEMFAAKKELVIVAYHLPEEAYDNFFLPIVAQEITYHPISYDGSWIEQEYLPRLKYLGNCLRDKTTPIQGVSR